MLYQCKNCRRQFTFEDEIEFCPYCGKPLSDPEMLSENLVAGASLVQKIDAIWGDEARIRSEFAKLVSHCIYWINDYSESTFAQALPQQHITKYAKHYASIKQSNNRKTLLIRIDQFLNSIDATIDNLSDGIPASTISNLESAHRNVEDIVKELYDFLGFRYETDRNSVFSAEKYTAEVLYTREQLRHLYELVITAYAKYKKCVADNNMFAAFASTSDYGVLINPWKIWLNILNQDADDPAAKQEDLPQIEKIISFMQQQNAKKYFGLLDEDFVPHVDAFWHGLEMLCECIDNHIRVVYAASGSRITQEEQERILRNVSSKHFCVNDQRLEGLIDLKKRFEQRA